MCGGARSSVARQAGCKAGTAVQLSGEGGEGTDMGSLRTQLSCCGTVKRGEGV